MKYGYFPDEQGDKNLDSKLKEVVGKNPITDSIVDDETKEQRYAVFGAVCDLKAAAEDLYCEGEMGWDEVMKNLSDAIKKLVGKEKDLIDAYEKDSEDNEKESETEEDDKEED